MSGVARGERGMTLIELVVAMSLMTIVLGATLTAFTNFSNADQHVQQQNDAQNRARLATDSVARELRNMASPQDGLTNALDVVLPYDLVFKEAGATMPGGSQNTRNLQRVRYCLDSSSQSNSKLWRQVQTWTSSTVPAVPSTASCPDPAWPTSFLVADKLVNRVGGADRPVFSYQYRGGNSRPHIISVHTDLFVDVTPNGPPAETRLSSGEFLRNQNRSPEAAMDVTAKPGTLVANGSPSVDPEGKVLSYSWSATNCTPSTGTGLIFTCTATAPTPRVVNVTLTVSDPAGLTASAGPQAVTVP